jgi:transposase
MRRYGLRDDQWERIKDFLPGRAGHVGGTAKDNRLFVEAVLYRYRAGIPWRDLPARFGDWKNIHRRFRRWCEGGVFEHVFKALAEDSDNEYMMLDSTIVRAHQHSAGARKKGGPACPPSVSGRLGVDDANRCVIQGFRLQRTQDLHSGRRHSDSGPHQRGSQATPSLAA